MINEVYKELKEIQVNLRNALIELSRGIEESGNKELIEKAREVQDRLSVELFQNGN